MFTWITPRDCFSFLKETHTLFWKVKKAKDYVGLQDSGFALCGLVGGKKQKDF